MEVSLWVLSGLLFGTAGEQDVIGPVADLQGFVEHQALKERADNRDP